MAAVCRRSWKRTERGRPALSSNGLKASSVTVDVRTTYDGRFRAYWSYSPSSPPGHLADAQVPPKNLLPSGGLLQASNREHA